MRNHMSARSGSLIIAAIGLAVYANFPAAGQTIKGAGSTFVAPAMSKWIAAYQHVRSGVTIHYQGIGSGAGIEAYKAANVDFGATDAPLSDTELAQMPTPTLHIPVIAGAVVLAYNIPNIGPGLRFSGDVIADIFLGKIKNWNDSRIHQENPTQTLPNLPIILVHRSDGSGTTYIFTDYLSSVSPEWKAKVSFGKLVNWPDGMGGNGNGGVASLIKQTPGALGYVELAYAVKVKLSFGPVRNQKGNYVLASVASTTAAADAAVERMQKDVRVSIVDGAGINSYPICGFTYVLISKTPKDSARAREVVDFLKWCVGPGQGLAATLLYGPLPKAVVAIDNRALSEVGVASAGQ